MALADGFGDALFGGVAEGEEDFTELVVGVDGAKRAAEVAGAVDAFDVEGELASEGTHGPAFGVEVGFRADVGSGEMKGRLLEASFIADHAVRVFEGDGDAVVEGGVGGFGLAGEGGGDFGECPGVTDGGAADHDAIAAGFAEHALSIGGGFDVAVTDEGNGDGFAHLLDEIPIGLALEALLGEAGVEGEHLGAGVLEATGEIGGGEEAVIPAGADFDGDGDADGLDDGADDALGGVGVFEEGGTGTSAADLGHPTAHIDVDDVSTVVFADPGGVGHFVGFAAEDLDSEGAFVGVDDEFFVRLFGLVVERHGADEFGEHEAGAGDALGDEAHGEGADIFHGGQEEGGIDGDGTDGKTGREVHVGRFSAREDDRTGGLWFGRRGFG